jgi:hypothetical protein
MPTTTDRNIAIQELEDITNERAILKSIRDDMDSPDEDEDNIDDMYEYELELIKKKKILQRPAALSSRLYWSGLEAEHKWRRR